MAAQSRFLDQDREPRNKHIVLFKPEEFPEAPEGRLIRHREKEQSLFITQK